MVQEATVSSSWKGAMSPVTWQCTSYQCTASKPDMVNICACLLGCIFAYFGIAMGKELCTKYRPCGQKLGVYLHISVCKTLPTWLAKPWFITDNGAQFTLTGCLLSKLLLKAPNFSEIWCFCFVLFCFFFLFTKLIYWWVVNGNQNWYTEINNVQNSKVW